MPNGNWFTAAITEWNHLWGLHQVGVGETGMTNTKSVYDFGSSTTTATPTGGPRFDMWLY